MSKPTVKVEGESISSLRASMGVSKSKKASFASMFTKFGGPKGDATAGDAAAPPPPSVPRRIVSGEQVTAASVPAPAPASGHQPQSSPSVYVRRPSPAASSAAAKAEAPQVVTAPFGKVASPQTVPAKPATAPVRANSGAEGEHKEESKAEDPAIPTLTTPASAPPATADATMPIPAPAAAEALHTPAPPHPPAEPPPRVSAVTPAFPPPADPTSAHSGSSWDGGSVSSDSHLLASGTVTVEVLDTALRQVLRAKVRSDVLSDAVGQPRMSLSDVMWQWLRAKFGVKSLALEVRARVLTAANAHVLPGRMGDTRTHLPQCAVLCSLFTSLYDCCSEDTQAIVHTAVAALQASFRWRFENGLPVSGDVMMSAAECTTAVTAAFNQLQTGDGPCDWSVAITEVVRCASPDHLSASKCSEDRMIMAVCERMALEIRNDSRVHFVLPTPNDRISSVEFSDTLLAVDATLERSKVSDMFVKNLQPERNTISRLRLGHVLRKSGLLSNKGAPKSADQRSGPFRSTDAEDILQLKFALGVVSGGVEVGQDYLHQHTQGTAQQVDVDMLRRMQDRMQQLLSDRVDVGIAWDLYRTVVTSLDSHLRDTPAYCGGMWFLQQHTYTRDVSPSAPQHGGSPPNLTGAGAGAKSGAGTGSGAGGGAGRGRGIRAQLYNTDGVGSVGLDDSGEMSSGVLRRGPRRKERAQKRSGSKHARKRKGKAVAHQQLHAHAHAHTHPHPRPHLNSSGRKPARSHSPRGRGRHVDTHEPVRVTLAHPSQTPAYRIHSRTDLRAAVAEWERAGRRLSQAPVPVRDVRTAEERALVKQRKLAYLQARIDALETAERHSPTAGSLGHRLTPGEQLHAIAHAHAHAHAGEGKGSRSRSVSVSVDRGGRQGSQQQHFRPIAEVSAPMFASPTRRSSAASTPVPAWVGTSPAPSPQLGTQTQLHTRNNVRVSFDDGPVVPDQHTDNYDVSDTSSVPMRPDVHHSAVFVPEGPAIGMQPRRRSISARPEVDLGNDGLRGSGRQHSSFVSIHHSRHQTLPLSRADLYDQLKAASRRGTGSGAGNRARVGAAAGAGAGAGVGVGAGAGAGAGRSNISGRAVGGRSPSRSRSRSNSPRRERSQKSGTSQGPAYQSQPYQSGYDAALATGYNHFTDAVGHTSTGRGVGPSGGGKVRGLTRTSSLGAAELLASLSHEGVAEGWEVKGQHPAEQGHGHGSEQQSQQRPTARRSVAPFRSHSQQRQIDVAQARIHAHDRAAAQAGVQGTALAQAQPQPLSPAHTTAPSGHSLTRTRAQSASPIDHSASSVTGGSELRSESRSDSATIDLERAQAEYDTAIQRTRVQTVEVEHIRAQAQQWGRAYAPPLARLFSPSTAGTTGHSAASTTSVYGNVASPPRSDRMTSPPHASLQSLHSSLTAAEASLLDSIIQARTQSHAGDTASHAQPPHAQPGRGVVQKQPSPPASTTLRTHLFGPSIPYPPPPAPLKSPQASRSVSPSAERDGSWRQGWGKPMSVGNMGVASMIGSALAASAGTRAPAPTPPASSTPVRPSHQAPNRDLTFTAGFSDSDSDPGTKPTQLRVHTLAPAPASWGKDVPLPYSPSAFDV